MTKKTRIPRSIDRFNGYIIVTAAYLADGTPTTNAARLGINENEVIRWTAFKTEWEPLYLKYSDKKNSRTIAIKDELYSIINETVLYDQTYYLLDRIATSPNTTIADMETFNIRKGVLEKKTRTTPQAPIVEPVSATLIPIGGGSLTVKCYSSTGLRASIFKGADCVQYLFATGDTPPASAEDDILKMGLSTRAIFNLVLGASNSGKKAFLYFRWYNTKYPELAGPWGSLQTILLL